MYLILLFVLGIIIQYYYGRLAQLVEHLLDVQRVSGSIPLASTTKSPRGFAASGTFCLVPGLFLRRQKKRLGTFLPDVLLFSRQKSDKSSFL